MKIAVDGGGLCTDKHFGTYTFSSALISALHDFDTTNKYSIYTFCQRSTQKNFEVQNLRPTQGWMKFRVPLEEIIKPKDIFLALNQALPLYISGKPLVFSHGFSFRLSPKFYSTDRDKLEKQVTEYVSRARFIILSSKRIYDEFVKFYPQTTEKLIILPYGIPQEFEDYKKVTRKPYFLFTGMNHKIKNIEFLIKAFEKFTSNTEYRHFQLYLAGPHQEYEKENIKVFPDLSREELRQLYREATGYLTASFYESFNFPVLEALSQRCPVVGLASAIIPEMKEYCSVVKNEDQFVNNMAQIVDGKNHKGDIEKLREKFSWRNFVYKLQELYLKA